MGEKTEQPTAKKLREARRQGNVAMSKDASGVGVFLIAVALAFATATAAAAAFERLFREVVRAAAQGAAREAAPAFLGETLGLVVRLSAPLLLAAAGVGLCLGLAQTGLAVSAQSLKPDLNKLNPGKQLKAWFSAKGMFELAKTLLKLATVLLLGYLTAAASLRTILRLGYAGPAAVALLAGGLGRSFLWRVGLVFVGVAGLDFGFQRWQWKKKLMMSKDDVKQEYKESEGDPHVKGHRRQLQHEMASGDVRRGVKRADAVVVNPTHLAVAIEYKRGETAPPRVTAKGRERTAQKIKSLARRHGVPVVRDVGLARALFALEVEDHVPGELYDAVAEILLLAWKLREEAER